MTVFRQWIQNSAKCFVGGKPPWFLSSKILMFHQNAWIQQQTSIENLSSLIKPKKPKSPYSRYATKVKPWIQEINPNAKARDIIKIIAQQWEKVDNDTRAKLEEEFEKEMVEYSSQLKAYKNSLGSLEREAIKKENKSKLQLKHMKTELGKPAKPTAAYIIFQNSKIHTRGSFPYKEWQKKIISEWKQLPDNEKDLYKTEFKLKYEVYKRHFEEWKKNMKKTGNYALLDMKHVKEIQLAAQNENPALLNTCKGKLQSVKNSTCDIEQKSVRLQEIFHSYGLQNTDWEEGEEDHSSNINSERKWKNDLFDCYRSNKILLEKNIY